MDSNFWVYFTYIFHEAAIFLGKVLLLDPF